MDKLVSIIVPVYNAEEFLAKCLDSLLAQSYSPIEIILVNDGSTDNSLDICNDYALKHKNIQVINQENKGVSVARNNALDVVKGEYIAFCDSDDYMYPEMISTLVKNMEENECELSVCGFFLFNETNIDKSKIPFDVCKKLKKVEMEIEVLSNKQCAGYLWNKLFKKEVIFKDEPLRFQHDIRVFEDLIFVLEYLRRIRYMCITPMQLYFYRNNPKGATNQRINDKKLSAVVAYEHILSMIESNYDNSTLGQIAWNVMMRVYAFYFKELLVNPSFKNRKFWLDYLSKGFRKYKNRYEFNSEWIIKEKIYITLLRIYSKFR